MELRSGINLGGFLSQCEQTKEHYEEFITQKDLEKIAKWGFDHVRLPIDYEVFETEDAHEKPSGYERVRRVVEWAKENNLDIILDLHKAYGYDFNNAGEEANSLFKNTKLQDRFVSLWDKISKDFCVYDNVAFELLNEVVEEENAAAWNELIARTVKTIRRNAPDTYIIYGGIQWNSAKTLKYLEKPVDDKILFTFHFYEPLLFTHQKAYWVKTMNREWVVSYPGTMEEYYQKSKILGDQGKTVYESGLDYIGINLIEDLVQDAIDVADNAGVRLYCGEFGVIDQAPIEDTLRWFRDVNEVFEKHDIGFAIWNYKEKDFGISGTHYESIRDDLLQFWTKKSKECRV
ncbi:glycoside hydrolase family 5 protein [Lachnobacterium bovis]|uniref:glycoside hydrolase family 5 protein n=1 Tax=Lachnobacterium bovis TaxID=140626 RepID=UPI0003B612F1|nr:cellulase family glycosylhydrolase [Lachnobacterium bovis]